jgi:hypothetical protein
MNSKMSRDSKDPMPNANNSMRIPPDGNSPITDGSVTHGQKKAERIIGSQRYDTTKPGPTQPTRQNEGGNVPVTGEDHAQGKAEHVTAAQRGGQNTAGTTANSPGR